MGQIINSNYGKKFGDEIEKIRSDQKIEVVEMNEMHTYIGNKKTIVGFGLLLIEMAKGSSIAYLVAEGQKQEGYYGMR